MNEPNVLSTFLATLAQGLLVLALPIVVAAAFQWVRVKSAEFKQNLSKENLAILETGIGMAVRAAEQAGLSGVLASGAEKKDYAINAVQAYLNRAGVPVDVAEISTLLEAEVHKQFSNYAPPVNTPETRSALIDKAIESAVFAAEQSGAKQLAVDAATNLAMSKKGYAVDLAQKYLTEHGITVNVGLIDGLIEAQIMRLKMDAYKRQTSAKQ